MTKKDMELKYKTDGYICKNRCPFKIKDKDSKLIYKIGSIGCAQCSYYKGFKGKTKNGKIIYCQKQGELKEKEAKND